MLRSYLMALTMIYLEKQYTKTFKQYTKTFQFIISSVGSELVLKFPVKILL